MKYEKKQVESVPLEAGTWKQVLKYEGEPVLTLSLRYPKLPEDRAAFRRIGRYYQRVADTWRARWEGGLYQRACCALAEARAQSKPFRPWEAALDFTVTYHENGRLSLYQDAYEYTGGAHGMTTRRGDTWRLRSGVPIPLRAFFPPRTRWRREVYATIREQVSAQMATGESLYLDGWEQAVAPLFDPERFYLTQEGIVVFYPLYALAPYAEGMPTFLVQRWCDA